MNISKYRKARPLKKEDCDPAIKLTITGAEEMNISRSAKDPEKEQALFLFVNEISSSTKKRDRDATSSILQPNSSHIAAETAGEKAVLRKRARRRHEITGTFPAAVQLPHQP